MQKHKQKSGRVFERFPVVKTEFQLTMPGLKIVLGFSVLRGIARCTQFVSVEQVVLGKFVMCFAMCDVATLLAGSGSTLQLANSSQSRDTTREWAIWFQYYGFCIAMFKIYCAFEDGSTPNLFSLINVVPSNQPPSSTQQIWKVWVLISFHIVLCSTCPGVLLKTHQFKNISENIMVSESFILLQNEFLHFLNDIKAVMEKNPISQRNITMDHSAGPLVPRGLHWSPGLSTFGRRGQHHPQPRRGSSDAQPGDGETWRWRNIKMSVVGLLKHI